MVNCELDVLYIFGVNDGWVVGLVFLTLLGVLVYIRRRMFTRGDNVIPQSSNDLS